MTEQASPLAAHDEGGTGLPPAVLEFVAGPEIAGQRVDRFLADAAPALSRTRVKALIEAGHVLLDGAVLQQPAEGVRAGGRYRVSPPPPVPAQPAAQHIPFTILYEDAELIVLDKPPGLVVHPAPGNEDGTLVNALLAHCGATLPGIGGEKRPGIMHRLDKDTSGLMVVAKTGPTLATLSADFAARRIDRAYLALCWGIPPVSIGEVAAPIGRDPRDRKRMAVVSKGGKDALTRYRLLQGVHGAVALVQCRLATGRTHQIRVHMAHQGHPLVGDPVYLRRTPAAARALPASLRDRLLDFPRQALHAGRLGFTHPGSGRPMLFNAPPPIDLAGLLAVAGLTQPTELSGPD